MEHETLHEVQNINHQFSYRCEQPLEGPDELAPDVERTEQVVLYCEHGHDLTIIEDGEIIEYVPPRAATRWTETFY